MIKYQWHSKKKILTTTKKKLSHNSFTIVATGIGMINIIDIWGVQFTLVGMIMLHYKI